MNGDQCSLENYMSQCSRIRKARANSQPAQHTLTHTTASCSVDTISMLQYWCRHHARRYASYVFYR